MLVLSVQHPALPHRVPKNTIVRKAQIALQFKRRSVRRARNARVSDLPWFVRQDTSRIKKSKKIAKNVLLVACVMVQRPSASPLPVRRAATAHNKQCMTTSTHALQAPTTLQLVAQASVPALNALKATIASSRARQQRQRRFSLAITAEMKKATRFRTPTCARRPHTV